MPVRVGHERHGLQRLQQDRLRECVTMFPEVHANSNLVIGAGTADSKGYQAVARAVGSCAPASIFRQRRQCGGARQQRFPHAGAVRAPAQAIHLTIADFLAKR